MTFFANILVNISSNSYVYETDLKIIISKLCSIIENSVPVT